MVFTPQFIKVFRDFAKVWSGTRVTEKISRKFCLGSFLKQKNFSQLIFKLFNIYFIAPNHQTDNYSLLFIGMFLCRLTPPLCLNFLGLIHMDTHFTGDDKNDNIVDVEYTKLMGHLDLSKFIKNFTAHLQNFSLTNLTLTLLLDQK